MNNRCSVLREEKKYSSQSESLADVGDPLIRWIYEEIFSCIVARILTRRLGTHRVFLCFIFMKNDDKRSKQRMVKKDHLQ